MVFFRHWRGVTDTRYFELNVGDLTYMPICVFLSLVYLRFAENNAAVGGDYGGECSSGSFCNWCCWCFGAAAVGAAAASLTTWAAGAGNGNCDDADVGVGVAVAGGAGAMAAAATDNEDDDPY